MRKTGTRLIIPSLLLLTALLATVPAFAQAGGPQVPPDLVGEWRRLTNHEDAHERGPGPDPGDTLTISATHLKESFIRRNGVQGSFRRTVTEHVSLDEPYMTWILIVNDADYLTAPLIRSVTFVRNPTGQVPVYPCSPQLEDYKPDRAKDYVPHYLPGTNPYLTEVPVKYQVPIEGVRGGAETEYPEFQPKVKALSAPTAQFTLKPEYKDASTRIAELADAQSRREPNWNDQKVEALHVQGNVYLLGGAGGNIALSAGEDGVVMIDSGVAPMSEKVLGAIQALAERPIIPLTRSSRASSFASTWQSTHSEAPAAIRMIINTSADSDHTGGNDKIAGSKIFHPIGVEGGDQSGSEVIVAHENVLQRMDALNTAKPDTIPARALPTTTYFSDRYRLHRFVNGEGVEVIHLPNAHSDGDSMIYFRGSDVIVAGDVFNSDTYPDIDVAHGGSIQGVIEALIRVTDLAYPEYMGQGGTMIIPGHGHISDIADAAYYRDMLIIVRDRVQDMIKKGMTLQQIKAAKPTMDYDPLFGRQPGATSKFDEAVYRSLAQRKAQ